MRKKKVLFVTESHQVASGFGTYAKQVLPRLHATGKYELAEFASYAHTEKNPNVDWLFFSNMPKTEKDHHLYNQSPVNHFGHWRFDNVILNFKPDIVLTYRDPWMDQWIGDSAARPFFHWAWMPTVDSAPQKTKWMENFRKPDALLAYSEYGEKVLLEQSNNKLNVIGCASPAIDPNVYKPVPNKKTLRKELGIDPDINIFGTVMRNQRRKLFFELMKAFQIFLKRAPKEIAEKTFLYLHTSYPEKTGWDITAGIQEFGLQEKVLSTYICRACNKFSCLKYQDAITTCPHCNQRAAVMPSVGMGLEIPDLIKIYNILDMYVQYAICEGFGMPQVEAAACGVPVAAVNYSAMEDVVRFTEGYPIKYRLYRELETGADRARPDNEHTAQILIDYFSMSEEDRNKKMAQVRNATLKRYDWDRTAKVWENYIDNYIPTGAQGQYETYPYQHIQIPEAPPQGLGPEAFVRWCFSAVLQDPKAAYSYEATELIQSICLGAHAETLEQFNEEIVWNIITNKAKNKFLVEQVRTGRQDMIVDDFIKEAYQRKEKA
jgi:glycosyltransferase involved in cell wall biosynthesis